MLPAIVVILIVIAILGYKAQRITRWARIIAGVAFAVYAIYFAITFSFGIAGSYTLRFTLYSAMMAMTSGILGYAFLRNKVRLPWRKV